MRTHTHTHSHTKQRVSPFLQNVDTTGVFPWEQVLAEAEGNPLQESSRGLTYDLLCAMANPSQRDTRGLSQLSELAERFAFSLLTGSQCGEPGKRSVSPPK